MLHWEWRAECYIANGEQNVTCRMENRMLHVEWQTEYYMVNDNLNVRC